MVSLAANYLDIPRRAARACRDAVSAPLRTFTLFDLVRGLSVTWRNLLRRKVTVRYPEERGQNLINKDMLLAIGDRYEPQIAANRRRDAPYR